VELLRQRPRSTALHRSCFGPSVSFQSAGSNAIFFPAAGLDSASGTDDPRLFEMMEAACQAALASSNRGRDLRLQVAEQIIELLPQGEATLGNVAQALAIGERSLQRRLGELGTSFEKIVEQTRRDLSDRLLAGDTPLSEISYQCGYSNASAYSRAARGWYGMAPQAMRQRLRSKTT
jgi:AraC-like DNA-binding protein